MLKHMLVKVGSKFHILLHLQGTNCLLQKAVQWIKRKHHKQLVTIICLKVVGWVLNIQLSNQLYYAKLRCPKQ